MMAAAFLANQAKCVHCHTHKALDCARVVPKSQKCQRMQKNEGQLTCIFCIFWKCNTSMCCISSKFLAGANQALAGKGHSASARIQITQHTCIKVHLRQNQGLLLCHQNLPLEQSQKKHPQDYFFFFEEMDLFAISLASHLLGYWKGSFDNFKLV